MSAFLGIDSGGSGTAAWVADGHGRVLGRARAGPGNPVKIGLRPAAKNILAAAHTALDHAGLRTATLDAVCAGVAGTGRPSIDRSLSALLQRGLRTRRFLLTTDGMIALESALGGSPGVVVISGTGSIAYARSTAGEVLRSGGWGSVFDDEGSGYDIGRSAVHAALAALDGRGPRTRLDGDICRALKLKEITEVVEKPLPPDRIAALLPAVLRAAQHGDATAAGLMEVAAGRLALLVTALLRRFDHPELPRVVCAGGVFRASVTLRRRFAEIVHESSPGARISLLRREPVEGALALAMRLGSAPDSLERRRR